MKVGLVDVDGHNYPNYALMKISAWHKERGDSVEWAETDQDKYGIHSYDCALYVCKKCGKFKKV